MRNMKRKFLLSVLLVAACSLVGLSLTANAQTQKSRAAFTRTAPAEQPLYDSYKGVRLGMTTQEARSKLGEPAMKNDDQDYFVFSEKETAQVAYDAAHKVIVISVDYLDGAGAPDSRLVVGGDLEVQPNGSLYKIVRYQNLGFWVSYNRSAGPIITVTITIQKI